VADDVVVIAAVAIVVAVATVVAVRATKWRWVARLTTERFSSFLANSWILKARPFTLGSLYTS
jgi:hypothetical protein